MEVSQELDDVKGIENLEELLFNKYVTSIIMTVLYII